VRPQPRALLPDLALKPDGRRRQQRKAEFADLKCASVFAGSARPTLTAATELVSTRNS
jgi:hypothetical protein